MPQTSQKRPQKFQYDPKNDKGLYCHFWRTFCNVLGFFCIFFREFLFNFILFELLKGVNSYRLENEEQVNVLQIDNSKVLESQINKLKKLRASRNESETRKILDEITECCRGGKGNLLELSVRAAKARATVGEITTAMEVVFKRYVAKDNLVSGAYKSEFGQEDEIDRVVKRVAEFEVKDGRRPRILVAKLGQDGHDRGAKIIASSFSDLGFDCDIGPLFAVS